MPSTINSVETFKTVLKRVETKQPSTHVIMGEFSLERGNYYLDCKNTKKFWDLYVAKLRDEIPMTIAEKQREYSPILFDADLAVPIDRKPESGKLYYLKTDVSGLVVKIIIPILKETLVDLDPSKLDCVFLDKPGYEKDGKYKHGFHLHFPGIVVNRKDFSMFIFPKIVDALAQSNLFPMFSDKSMILDKNACNNAWLMYGSAKDIGKTPYKFNCIITEDGRYVSMKRLIKTLDLSTDTVSEHDLPRLLSIQTFDRQTFEVASQAKQGVEVKIKKEIKEIDQEEKTPEDQGRYREFVRSLTMITPDWASDDRDTWLKVGFIVHKVFDGDDEGFEIWDEFSSRSDKYPGTDEIRKQWDRITDRKDGVSIGTLVWLAKQGNLEEYLEIKKRSMPEKQRTLYELAHVEGHGGVSDLFHQEKGQDIVAVSDDIVYICDDVSKLWKRKGSDSLLNIIRRTLLPIYTKALLLTADEQGSMYKKPIEKMIKDLNHATFLSGVSKLYLSEHVNIDFEQNLNRVPNELPIMGGDVIDFRTLEVRKRTRQDLYSDFCPVRFQKRDRYEKAEKFIGDIANNDAQLTKYMQRLLGYFMTGYVSDKGVYICWGAGNNGKSTLLMTIMKSILKSGLYFASVSEDVLLSTGKKVGRATPELIPLTKARYAILAETDEKAVLNAPRIKSLTGGDDIDARALYGNSFSFATQSKLILMSNEKPLYDSHDDAMVNRIRLVPFKQTFVRNKENNDYIKKLLANDLDEIFSYFAVGAFEYIQTEEMGECDFIAKETEEYTQENNIIKHFMEANVEIGKDYQAPSNSVYSAYKFYCQEGGNDAYPLKKFTNILKKNFTQKRTKKGMFWLGLKLVG